MKLTFNLKNCITKFTSFNVYKRTEVSFSASPKSFTITTLNDLLITEKTDNSDEEKQIEFVIVAESFDDNIHGFFDDVNGFGISAALSCTQAQMSELNNFIVNGLYPKEIEISIKEINLVHRNFKIDKDRYIIESWEFII
jgi:hypothetical protein